MATAGETRDCTYEMIVDAVWKRYRAIADETLARGAHAVVPGDPSGGKGILYLFVVNCMARWLDRLDREPDPCRRRTMLHLLVGADEEVAGRGKPDEPGGGKDVVDVALADPSNSRPD